MGASNSDAGRRKATDQNPMIAETVRPAESAERTFEPL
jgi:hypothetical protein